MTPKDYPDFVVRNYHAKVDELVIMIDTIERRIKHYKIQIKAWKT